MNLTNLVVVIEVYCWVSSISCQTEKHYASREFRNFKQCLQASVLLPVEEAWSWLYPALTMDTTSRQLVWTPEDDEGDVGDHDNLGSPQPEQRLK